MKTEGSVALVTGGAVRVGRAIALSLANMGARVVVHYHQSAAQANLAVAEIRNGGGTALAVRADLTKAAQVERLKEATLEAYGRIDILINNAAIFLRTPFGEWNEQDWDRLMDTNLKSVFFCCKAFGEVMLQQGRGRIINIADVAGIRPWKDYIPYCVTKAGVIALTQGLAKALAPHVLVNAIAPGAVLWPEHYSSEDKAKRLKNVPLGQVGSPEEVAKTVRFLIESDYITGTVLPVDGGRSVV